MTPAPLLVRNRSLALDARPIAYLTAARAIVDVRNGKQCCCGGMGRCTSCCPRNYLWGPRDRSGFCCFGLTDAPLKTRLTHLYALYDVRDPFNGYRWIEEMTATNLPQDIAVPELGHGNWNQCGVNLAWDWSHWYYEGSELVELVTGSNSILWHKYSVGSTDTGDGRFFWEPEGAIGLHTFLRSSYTGNFRNPPLDASFQSTARPEDNCLACNATWSQSQGTFRRDTITVQALLEVNATGCAPRSGSDPCAVCE